MNNWFAITARAFLLVVAGLCLLVSPACSRKTAPTSQGGPPHETAGAGGAVVVAAASREGVSAGADGAVIPPPGAPGTPASGRVSADCYATTRAAACPPNPSDPSGRHLPTSGAPCSLPRCKPCGSATIPAYRDAKGKAAPGWCICVPKSDDSEIGVYSCFSVADWGSR